MHSFLSENPAHLLVICWPEESWSAQSLTPRLRFHHWVPAICRLRSLECSGGSVQALSRPLARQAGPGSSGESRSRNWCLGLVLEAHSHSPQQSRCGDWEEALLAAGEWRPDVLPDPRLLRPAPRSAELSHIISVRLRNPDLE